LTRAIEPEAPANGPIRLDVGTRTVRVTHPERVIWPITGTTKRELIDYLIAISPVLVAHVRRRPTMLWRFPEGVDGPGWFQAQCRGRPPWVETMDVTGRRGDILRYCVIDEPATLAWLANIGTVELHPHGWTVERPDTPTHVVFDLDPGPPAGIREAAGVALTIAERLRNVGLEPVVKTSGGRGLHVAAPLDPDETFGRSKAFGRALAEELASEAPDRIVAQSERSSRAGRVFIDWLENDRNRQLVAAYSPRATQIPQVSTPLLWDEVEAAAAGHVRTVRQGFVGVLDRVGHFGDIWTGTGRPAGRLP